MQTPNPATNRDAMPLLAAAVDELRSVFGAVKVTYAEEGGVRISVPFEERFPEGRM